MEDLNSIGIELCTDAIKSSARICRICVLVQAFPESKDIFQFGALILEANRNRMVMDLVKRIITDLLGAGQDVSEIMTAFTIATEATQVNNSDKIVECFQIGTRTEDRTI